MKFNPPIKIGSELAGFTVYSVEGALSYLQHYYKEYNRLLATINQVINDRFKQEAHFLNELKQKIRWLISQVDENERVQYWKTKYLKLKYKQNIKHSNTDLTDQIVNHYLKNPVLFEVTRDQFDLFRDRHYVCKHNEDGSTLELYSLSGDIGDWVQLKLKP